MLAVVVVAFCGAMGVISSTQTWLTVVLRDGAQEALEVPGASAIPVLAPLSLAVLALGAALSIAGLVLRYAFGGVALLIAGVLAWLTAPVVFGPPVAAVATVVTESTGIAGEASVAELVANQRFEMRTVTLFVFILSAVGILLAATGLYALTSFTVAQRTREIGIRTALGADAGHVIATIARRALGQLSVGVALGSASGWYLVHDTSPIFAIDSVPSGAERRTFQRVRVNIYGRFMLEDRSEHQCQIIDMSPGNVSLRCKQVGEPGEKVIAYFDHLGRIEGVITRRLETGFAMTVVASERKKDKLAAQLTWLANKHELDLPEDRRHERVAPRNPLSVLHLGDGRQYPCRIIDLSLSGAAIEIEVKPAIGVQVTLGTMRGQVVRHFEDGLAIEFAVIQRPESLDAEFGGRVS